MFRFRKICWVKNEKEKYKILFLCFLGIKENESWKRKEKKWMGKVIESGDVKIKFRVIRNIWVCLSD